MSTQTSPTNSRRRSITVARSEQANAQGPIHGRRRSGGLQHSKNSSETKGNDDVGEPGARRAQTEAFDPAIVSSSLQPELRASKSDDFIETDRSSQVYPSVEVSRLTTEAQSSGLTSSTTSGQQPSTTDDIALSHIPDAAGSPSALDGSQEAAKSSKSPAPNKGKRSKANSSKKLSVSENKQGEPLHVTSRPAQYSPPADGKVATWHGRGQTVKGLASTKAEDQNTKSKTNPTKTSSTTASTATGGINPTAQGSSHSSPLLTDPKDPQHDVKLVAGEEQGDSASGPAKNAKTNRVSRKEMLETTAGTAELSQSRKEPSPAVTHKFSASIHRDEASVSPALTSTTAKSSFFSEHSNSVVEGKKSSQLTRQSVDSALLQGNAEDDEVENKVGGMQVTQTPNDLSIKRDLKEEGQPTNIAIESTLANTLITTASDPAGADHTDHNSIHGRKNNKGPKGQRIPNSHTAKSGQTGKSDRGKPVTKKSHAKGDLSREKETTEVNLGARPDVMTSKKTHVQAGMAPYLQATTRSNEALDPMVHMKTGMEMNAKTSTEAAAGAPATDITGTKNYTEKESPAKKTVAGQIGQQEALNKISIETPRTLARIVAPQPLTLGSGDQSPERKQPPPIPERSSSLAVVSTPIKTHLKKKPKIPTPSKEKLEVVEKAISEERTSVGN